MRCWSSVVRAALLPAENTTGNFVKVVQRLPVRIELTNYNPETLRPTNRHASDRTGSDIGKSRAERIREIWAICVYDVSLWVRM